MFNIKCYILWCFTCIISIFWPQINLLAQDKIYPNKLNQCKISDVVINNYEPNIFHSTNNLLHKPGEEPVYCGEQIIIYGKILDQHCIPLSDLKVYIWQANCSGRYNYVPLKTDIDKSLIDINPNISFTGNGIATTNNNGAFSFVTVYPHKIHKLPPHINIRVEHHIFGSFQTRVVLKNKRVKNASKNPELSSIVALNNTNASIYAVSIVVPWVGHKSY